MKTRKTAAVVLIVLGTGTAAWAADANPARPEDIHFSTTTHGEVVIPVSIGGQGPYRFLLDTGSSHTAINQTLATALGAVLVAKAPTASSVGWMWAGVVRLSDVAVGSARAESLLATSLPSDVSRWLGDGISGVLGQDFLSQFDYTLDFRASRLSWNDTGQALRGIRLVLEASHGRYLVSLPQGERCGSPVRLVPDSGAREVVLFTGTQADRLPFGAPGTPMRVFTLAGEGTARRVIVRALRVGSATLWDVSAARVVLPEGTPEDGDGLLPLALFARVSFHHGAYMVVQPE